MRPSPPENSFFVTAISVANPNLKRQNKSRRNARNFSNDSFSAEADRSRLECPALLIAGGGLAGKFQEVSGPIGTERCCVGGNSKGKSG